jgi:hypothetical protein
MVSRPRREVKGMSRKKRKVWYQLVTAGVAVTVMTVTASHGEHVRGVTPGSPAWCVALLRFTQLTHQLPAAEAGRFGMWVGRPTLCRSHF